MWTFHLYILVICLAGFAKCAKWSAGGDFIQGSYSEDVIMKCDLEGDFVAFYKKGTKITPIKNKYRILNNTESITLEVLNVEDSDYGNYTCKDKTSADNITLKISVSIEDLQNQSLAIGFDGKIETLIHGMPRPLINWYKDEKLLIALSSSGQLTPSDGRYTIGREGSLTIKNIMKEDGGIYKIQYILDSKRKESTVGIDVGNKPEIDIGPQSSYTKTKGQTLKLKCSWKFTDTKPVWKFTNKDGKTVTIDPAKIDNSGYTITAISIDDVGNYKCETKNKFGSSTVETKIVSVITPANITSSFGDEKIPIGTKFNLVCEASGVPAPKVKIFQGNELIANGNNGSAQFSFTMEKKYTGVFTCKAGNNARSESGRSLDVNKTMTIDMLTPPEIDRTIIKSPIVSAVDYFFSFACRASGNPTPNITIQQGGNDVTGQVTISGNSVNASYSVKGVKETDFSDIICKAINTQGEDNVTVEMKKVVKASPPEGLEQRGNAGLKYIDLEWDSVDSADSYVVYINKTKNVSSSETTISVRDLFQNTFYSFQVASVNIAGIGNASKPVVLVTSDIIPPGKVRNMEIKDITYISADVSWDAPKNVELDPGLDITYILRYCVLTNDTEGHCKTNKLKDTSDTLKDLKDSAMYRVTVIGDNQGVNGEGVSREFETKKESTDHPKPVQKNRGMSVGVIAAIIIVIIIIILLVVDVFCCFFNHCGFTHCCVETLCPSKQNKYMPTDTKEPEEKEKIKVDPDDTSNAENVV